MRFHSLAMLLAAALAVQAQEPARPGFIRFHPLLNALDRDRDGALSQAELQSAPAELAKLDSDKDGSVSAQEMRPAGSGRGPGSGPGESRPPEVAEMVKSLFAFDANGDGKLSKQEVPERMQGLFDRADADKDGILTTVELTKLAESQAISAGGGERREGRGGRGPMGMDPVMAALDTDRDGILSPSEIRNSVAALKALDKNGDGQIMEEEFQFGRRPRQ